MLMIDLTVIFFSCSITVPFLYQDYISLVTLAKKCSLPSYSLEDFYEGIIILSLNAWKNV